MNNGNLLKEKKEYILELFTTREGLIDFFLGTFIWGFIVVKYTNIIFNKIKEIIAIIGFIGDYISYLVFGIIMMVLGMLISIVIHRISKYFFNI